MTRPARTALLVSAVGLFLVGASVLRRATDGGEAGRAAPVAAPAGEALPKGSLYDLGLQVRDADGNVRSLDDLRGHPVLASMFFGKCPTICPVLIEEIKRLAETAPPELRRDVRVLLVSFDPERDTPAVLADVARVHQLDPQRWRVSVATDEASARYLAAVLGIRYRASAGGLIDHTARITVFDRAGVVRGQSEDPRVVAASLAALAVRG
jgi:protein SCO1/2